MSERTSRVRALRAILIASALVISRAIGVEAQTLMLLIVYLWPPYGPSPIIGVASTTPIRSVCRANDDNLDDLLDRLREAEGPERERLRLIFKRQVRREFARIWSDSENEGGDQTASPDG